MAPLSTTLAFLASNIASLSYLPYAADAAPSSASSLGAFDDDSEGQCTLSLLQRHTELTRRSHSQPNGMAAAAEEQAAQQQVAFAADSIKTTAEVSAMALRSLSGIQSSIATLAALNVPAADNGEPDLQAMGPDGIDDLVADINQNIDFSAQLLKEKLEAGARSREAVTALRASISDLITAPVTASDSLRTPEANLARLGAHASGATRRQKKAWRPNEDADPRSNWGKTHTVQDPERYSRLQPENRGAPQNPESYEALGSDAANENNPVEVDEVESDDEPAKGGGLFAPSKSQKKVHGGPTHKQSEKQESAAAKSNPEADIKAAFDLFDTDGSSAVNQPELRAAMKVLGFAPQGGQLHKMFVDIDADHNGAIDYSEFLRMMQDHHLMGSS